MFNIAICRMLNFTRGALSPGSTREPLKVNDIAPDFELLDQHGMSHKLSNYTGRWLALYFYPKDDTPDCTAQACAFRNDIIMLKRGGIAVLGISTDDVRSHRRFAEKHHLPFPLLSDERGEVAPQYDSFIKVGPFRVTRRNTFLIDPDNRIARIYRKVQPDQHSSRILDDIAVLRRLQTRNYRDADLND